jgi:hypothetical protein
LTHLTVRACESGLASESDSGISEINRLIKISEKWQLIEKSLLRETAAKRTRRGDVIVIC